MSKIKKIRNCIRIWKTRDLTLKGKILIIKTFLISQLGFELETKRIPINILRSIDTIILNFLWDEKQPLVNRKTMYLKPEDGGLI